MTAIAAADSVPAATGQTIGYVRVSTDRQTYAQQEDAIRRACPEVARVFGEKVSGKAETERVQQEAMLAYVRPGDTLVCSSVDRLGRSTLEVLAMVKQLTDRGIRCRFLREGADSDTIAGRAMIGMMATLAEMERELMLERQRAARDAAAERGRQTGRPAALTADQVRAARRELDAGTPMADVLRMFGAKRSTLYRALGKLEEEGATR